MGLNNLKNLIYLLLFICPILSRAQKVNTDCRTAIIICDDGKFTFKPKGRGIDDFSNPKNQAGCLERRENISAWYYFEFRRDMPANSEIYFSLSANRINTTADYDFAVYGPNPTCDSLGGPRRCSFAAIRSDPSITTIETGLRPLEPDTTEDLTGNGWLKPMIVQPGQGFFLLIDYFAGVGSGVDTINPQNFTMTWGGTAKPFLNCIANPNCDQVRIDLGKDQSDCPGNTFFIQGLVTKTAGKEKYQWTATPSLARSFIDKDTIPFATLRIPTTFEGNITYKLTVSEGNCIKEKDVGINIFPLPKPKLIGDTIICNNATSLIKAKGGFRSYSWPDGTRDSSFVAPKPGTYAVTVTSFQGCVGSAQIQIKGRTAPAKLISGDTVICFGAMTTLSIVDTFNTYAWSTGAITPKIDVKTGGLFTVTITDKAGCSYLGQIKVTLSNPGPPTIQGNLVYCAGGSVNLQAQTGFTSYKWSTGATTAFIPVSSPGLYAVTATNNFGCSNNNNVTVTERVNPTPQINGTLKFCSNTSTVLNAPSGFARYRWSTNANDTILLIRVAGPGTYKVTVTDQFGCQGVATAITDTFAVPRPKLPASQTFCANNNVMLNPGNFASYKWSTGATTPAISPNLSGTYKVTVSNGNCTAIDSSALTIFPLPRPDLKGNLKLCPGEVSNLFLTESYAAYKWTGGATTPTLQVGTPGQILVVVTDVNGCSNRDSVFIQAVSKPKPTILGAQPFCEDDPIPLRGDNGYVNYRWSTGDTTLRILIFKGGTYRLSVTDNNGCKADTAVTVNAFSNPRPVIKASSPLCSGRQINLSVQQQFTDYAWSNSQNQTSIQINSGGMYSIVVTNSNGCKNRDSIIIVENKPKFPRLPNPLNFCDGEVRVVDAGPGYKKYQWSNGDTTRSITITKTGNFKLTVQDSNSCVTEQLFSTNAFPAPKVNIIGASEFCSGQKVFLYSGAGFAKYQWSTGDTTDQIPIVKGGEYILTITDDNGCSAIDRRNVIEKISPRVDIVGDSVICREDSTFLSIKGDVLGAILWTNGRSTNTILVKKPGIYGVQLVGLNGCVGSDQIRVLQTKIPFPIIDGDRFYCKNDTLKLEVLEGFKTYRWTNGDTTNIIKIISPGIYGITIEDDLGCNGRAQVKVIQNTPSPIKIQSPRFICPGDVVTMSIVTKFPDITWNNGGTTPSILVTTSGLYRVEVRDTNDCAVVDTFNLKPAPPPIFKITGAPYFCKNTQTVLEIPSGFDRVRWENGDSITRRVITIAGQYRAQVRNEYGCRESQTLNVSEIPFPPVDPLKDSTFTCRRPSLVLGGPRVPKDSIYKVFWVGPGIDARNQNSFRPLVTKAGKYHQEVTDTLHGCVSISPDIELKDLGYTPQVGIRALDTLDCVTQSIGLDTINTAIGSIYKYQWYDSTGKLLSGSNRSRIIVTQPGVYSLQILDTLKGCNGQTSIVLKRDSIAPIAQILGDRTLTCARDSIFLIGQIPVPGENYGYKWSFPKGNSLFNQPGRMVAIGQPGLYRLQVTNLRSGCMAVDSATVGKDTLRPIVDAGPSKEIDCIVTEVELSGVRPSDRYAARWFSKSDPAFGATTLNPRVFQPGVYFLELTNPDNGCKNVDSTSVALYGKKPDSLALDFRNIRCFGQKDGVIRVRNVNGGQGPYLYRINKQTNFTPQNQFTNLAPGTYKIFAQDARGCEVSRQITILEPNQIELDLGPDQSIYLGNKTVIGGVTNRTRSAIKLIKFQTSDTSLRCDTCLNKLTVRPITTTTYFATIQDTAGCSTKDDITINVDAEGRIFIPNAFSPNGDGSNDRFELYTSNSINKVMLFSIFDRWGEKVFTKENFSPKEENYGWDGKHKGEQMNPAVYVYQVTVEFYGGQIVHFKGDMTLVR
jgi:gliding motility-associated-like protein